MAEIYAPVQKVVVPGHDGTPLTACLYGDGPVDWIIAPGLGTPLITWKYVAERFGRACRILTWEARGNYSSGTPADWDKLRIEDHAADLFALADHFGMKRFVLGGWSMGVQISLEAYHQRPDRVKLLVLINGAPGHLLSTAYGVPGFEKLAVSVLKFASLLGQAPAELFAWLLQQSWTLPVMRKMQIFTANDDFFGEMVAGFASLDFPVYWRMMLLVNEHDATPYLPEVAVPTLITAGTKDLMTPLATAQLMTDRIKDAELFVVPNGTHYTVVEYPEIINLRLERFFRDHLPKFKLD
ncbi:MAG: alpha/beta hydrolase [Myxococcales bacterium]|nr:alpha/beta hydrolase [Myxococcales bacterium]